jgi:hypothetical protein
MKQYIFKIDEISLTKVLIAVFFSFFISDIFGQATLPVSRTSWSTTPTGWTDSGTGYYTTGFACSGSDGGKLDNTGDFYKIFYSGSASSVNFAIKSTAAFTGIFDIQESVDGATWSTIITYTTITTSCTTKTLNLSCSSRYLRFYLTSRTSENITIDDVSITSGSCVGPSLTGAVIDACSCASVGNEAPGEAIFINSGSYSLDVTTVAQATANVSILYGIPVSASLTVASNCITKSYTNNAAAVTCLNGLSGCSGTYVDALGTTIPANSIIMVVRSNFCCSATPENNFAALCGAGTIYMLFSDDASWSSGGHLKNHGGSVPADCIAPTDRYFSFISAAASSTFNANYDACDLTAGGATFPYDGGCVSWSSAGGTASSYYNNDCNYSKTILPIELVDFYATNIGSKNDIRWKVASEIDVKNYVIEKSNNGIDFFTLGIVPIQTNDNGSGFKKYSIIDINPFDDITYYRLGIDNNNEDVVYYQIISTDGKLTEWKTSIYQDQNNLNVEFKNSVVHDVSVSLYDLSGKLLSEQLVTDSKINIDVNAIEQGLYFLKISDPYKSVNQKVVIVK